MLENWNTAIVTEISLAIYVAPGAGKAIHHDRPFHGFVINDVTSSKNIYFSDGTVLHTGPNEVHYLPKGSSYRVESITQGGCWAINFGLLTEIDERPFALLFRNHETVLRLFREATAAWMERSELCCAVIRKCVYEILIQLKKEQSRSYMPSEKERLIQPAVDLMNREFTRNDLSVKALAAQCRISEAYFRRIFADRFSVSPKAYITSLRLEHAKRLLQSAQFSVSEVAQMCGYFEPCHFSREFTKYAGVSPKGYAKAKQALVE